MAQTQDYNPELIENLATAFPRRNDASFAWANAVSLLLNLPRIRGVWPMSSEDENHDQYDLSGQGRTMTSIGSAPTYTYGLQPFVRFNGSNYLQRATESGLEITGSLTLGCWIKFRDDPTTKHIMTKRDTGAANTAWILQTDGSDQINMSVASGGSYYAIQSNVALIEDVWYFVAGQYYPSTRVAVWLNENVWENVTTIPASINNVSYPFQIAGFNGANNLPTADIALAFLSQYFMSDAQVNAIYWLTRPLFFGS